MDINVTGVSSKTGIILFGLLFLAVGALFVWFGGKTIIGNKIFANGTVMAQGTVINVRSTIQHSLHSTTGGYIPTIDFTANNGQAITFIGTQEAIPYSIGDQVPILYKANDPNNARTQTSINDDFGSWLLILIGLIVALPGVLVLERRKDVVVVRQ